MEVLTELLLSLLSRPSQLMRRLVNVMFTVICPYLTPRALDIILQVKFCFLVEVGSYLIFGD